MEKLEEQAHQQLVQQKIDSLNKYLDHLFKEMSEAGVFYLRNQALSSAALLAWLIAVIALGFNHDSGWAKINESVANLLWWITVLRVWLFCIPWQMGSLSEIKGCLKTLELLGMIDPLDSGRHKKLKMAEESKIAKVWEWLKQKARSEAYSPA